MELACITLVLVILHSIRYAFGNPGDPVMYLPPLEVRTTGNRQNIPFENQFTLDTSRFQQPFQQIEDSVALPQNSVPQQQILHTSSQVPIRTTTEKPFKRGHNITFNDLIEALNQVSENEEPASKSRAAGRDYENSPYPTAPYPSYSRPYGSYPLRPSYGPYAPPYQPAAPYQPAPPYQPPAAYLPPTSVHHTAPKTLKPELTSFLKPVTTKVASKVSGLIGLVLSLLTGSAPDDLEMKGFKDIVINGIVKPLLIAKGGIKSLISKLTIPVISLLLINLEVLITIWWLWEECPEPVHPPAYSYPKPSYNYNSYT